MDYVESNFSQGKDSHSGVIRCLSFNKTGLLLASGGDDNSVRIWDVKSGKLLFHIEGHSAVLSLVWTPDPYILIVGFEDNVIATVVITEVTLEVYGIYLPESPRKPRYPIECLALTPFSVESKGSRVRLAAGGHQSLRVWDLLEETEYQWAGGHEVPVPFSNGPNDNLKVLVTGLEWIDESVLLISYMFHGLLFWDSKNQVKRFSIPAASNIGRMALHPNRKTVATYNMSDGVDIWDAQTGERIQTCKTTMTGENFPLPVTFLHDGSSVAAGHMEGQVTLWNVKNGNSSETLPHTGESVYALASFRYTASDTYPNRCIIATGAVKGDSQHKIRFWEATSRSDLQSSPSFAAIGHVHHGVDPRSASVETQRPPRDMSQSRNTYMNCCLTTVGAVFALVIAVFIGIR